MESGSGCLTARRAILTAWYDAWQRKHNARLACARLRVPVRVGRNTYLLTPEAALHAAAKTFEELFVALEKYPDWGCDIAGRPSELAMRGLISRRLRARVQDELRIDRSWEVEAQSFQDPVRTQDDAAGEFVLADIVGSHRQLDDFEAFSSLKSAFVNEPPATREIVLRRLAGEKAPEIASHLELAPTAVRKRLSRFRSTHGAMLGDAA